MKKITTHPHHSSHSMPPLNESSMDPNPFCQFSSWFDAAMQSGIDQPEAMFLATSSPEGIPSGRMVLLKECSSKGFVFFTNYNSRKGKEVAGNPFAALTFYWKEFDRQVRITGKANRIPARESDLYFDSRPLESRIAAIISPQSRVIRDRNYLDEGFHWFLRTTPEEEIERPDNWGGFIIRPYLYEFWQAGLHRLHDRIQYRKEKNRWVIERLAP
jgi:pyridoxamine 5'-phosphate oxidase